MAKSLAFWIEGGNPASSKIELHFNYWSLQTQKNNHVDYLDIGIKFSEVSSFDSLNIYLPLYVDGDNYIAGLGREVCKDQSLVSAIFNTGIVGVKPNGERYDISFAQDKDSELRFHSQIELGKQGDGAYISRYDSADIGSTISFPMKLFLRLRRPASKTVSPIISGLE